MFARKLRVLPIVDLDDEPRSRYALPALKIVFEVHFMFQLEKQLRCSIEDMEARQELLRDFRTSAEIMKKSIEEETDDVDEAEEFGKLRGRLGGTTWADFASARVSVRRLLKLDDVIDEFYEDIFEDFSFNSRREHRGRFMWTLSGRQLRDLLAFSAAVPHPHRGQLLRQIWEAEETCKDEPDQPFFDTNGPRERLRFFLSRRSFGESYGAELLSASEVWKAVCVRRL
jgi:hypothetical protein